MRLHNAQLSLLLAAALGLTSLTGCDRRTPDERLATAIQFYQQGDAASAEMEALKVVEKAPEDPASVQASVLLSQIYMQQNRLEEAQMRLEGALKNVSQLEPAGKEVLRMYLATLNAQKKYDDSLKTIEKYQKEYAEDPGTSLSLEVAKADIQTLSGQTTAAREVLTSIMDQTTAPAEMALYRDLYMKTYLRDENTTAAAAYLREGVAKADSTEAKISLLSTLAALEAQNGNYESSRQVLQQLTELAMAEVKKEPLVVGRAARALQLGQIYLAAGNLPGAQKTFQALYDINLGQQDAVQAIVNSLMETHMRMGETSATQELLQDAAKKYPQAPFAAVLKRMDEVIAAGQLQQIAPEDTSTVVMKYRQDPNVLWPAELPNSLAEAARTSGSVTQTPSDVTSGSQVTSGATEVRGAVETSGTLQTTGTGAAS